MAGPNAPRRGLSKNTVATVAQRARMLAVAGPSTSVPSGSTTTHQDRAR
jgi:hypothetical protein